MSEDYIFKVNDQVYHILYPYSPATVIYVSTNTPQYSSYHYYKFEVRFDISIDPTTRWCKSNDIFKTSKEAVVAAVTRRLLE